MADNNPLLTPFQLGALSLPNRIVMAPLTRSRATDGNVPSDMAIEYYVQRASAGLIISEATQISPEGQGYIFTPGIHSPEQLAGWKRITSAVHAAQGRIIAQLWHVGRISHTSFQPNGQAPVAPSAIRATGKTYIKGGFTDFSEPRALATEEIPRVVNDYRQATRNALEAGFDGVEVHGANGYLIDQFLRDKTNHRGDQYGGTIEHRTRFLLEVMQAVIAEAGRERTGIRLAPVTPSNDISDSNPTALFTYVIDRLNELAPAFIHVVEGATGGARDYDPTFNFPALRKRFNGAYIANNGYTPELARKTLDEGHADLIAFGKLFIANPDLVERIRRSAPLNEPDAKTFYTPGPKGYIDYPSLAA